MDNADLCDTAHHNEDEEAKPKHQNLAQVWCDKESNIFE